VADLLSNIPLTIQTSAGAAVYSVSGIYVRVIKDGSSGVDNEATVLAVISDFLRRRLI
jgi:hypothetical protein